MIIRSTTSSDASWVSQALTNLWGSTRMVSRGKLIELSGLNGFIAEEDGRKVGLITYVILKESEGSQSMNKDSSQAQNDNSMECEITSINALTPGKGIGGALLEAVQKQAKEKLCKELVVVTTNDNPKAVNFYEKNGFTIFAVRKNIMEEYRKLKPEIPLVGNDGIPLTDEIELHKEI